MAKLKCEPAMSQNAFEKIQWSSFSVLELLKMAFNYRYLSYLVVIFLTFCENVVAMDGCEDRFDWRCGDKCL